MPRRSKSSNAAEMLRIEELIADLSERLNGLNRDQETSDSSVHTSDFVREALETIMAQVRERADTVTSQVADHAAKIGSDAIKRAIAEAEHHPLATLAVAAGVGFLLGSTRR